MRIKNTSHIKMNLHIFNPEHDMALALNGNTITLPHAIQEFKMNLGFIPALWADDGDCILVDDVSFAVKASGLLRKPHADVLFVEKEDLRFLPITAVIPWGWDRCLCEMLRGQGVAEQQLLSAERLSSIREMSSRRQTSRVLDLIRNDINDDTCGESFFITDTTEVGPIVGRYGRVVLKSPWSSSGRGVKYMTYEEVNTSKSRWIENTIVRQGGIMIEPYYNKVKDFAMEFYSDGEGNIDYKGLSLFCTDKGRYTGNIIASENEKLSMLGKYVQAKLLEEIKNRIADLFSGMLRGVYRGNFGVDMMITADSMGNRFLVNPCVEVNLRMTMGAMANSVRRSDDEPKEIMRIVHDVNYMLKFETVGNNFVNVI